MYTGRPSARRTTHASAVSGGRPSRRLRAGPAERSTGARAARGSPPARRGRTARPGERPSDCRVDVLVGEVAGRRVRQRGEKADHQRSPTSSPPGSSRPYRCQPGVGLLPGAGARGAAVSTAIACFIGARASALERRGARSPAPLEQATAGVLRAGTGAVGDGAAGARHRGGLVADLRAQRVRRGRAGRGRQLQTRVDSRQRRDAESRRSC